MGKEKFLFAGFVAAIGITFIPIYFIPKANPDVYRNVQRESRKDIVQEDVQPGNMKIWSDPFDRKKPN